MGTFLLVLFLWVFSVCLHEFAHAYVAYRGGDYTVVDKGYLTLNPMKYLDPINSVLMPVLFLVLGGIGLPGASVYINRGLLRSHHWDSAVSLAGPGMNFALMLLLVVLLHQDAIRTSDYAPTLAFLALLQASAVVLNLMPLPGFDGYGAIAPYLPPGLRQELDQYGGYVMLGFLMLIFVVPGFGALLWKLIGGLAALVDVPLGLAQVGLAEFRFWRH